MARMRGSAPANLWERLSQSPPANYSRRQKATVLGVALRTPPRASTRAASALRARSESSGPGRAGLVDRRPDDRDLGTTSTHLRYQAETWMLRRGHRRPTTRSAHDPAL